MKCKDEYHKARGYKIGIFMKLLTNLKPRIDIVMYSTLICICEIYNCIYKILTIMFNLCNFHR